MLLIPSVTIALPAFNHRNYVVQALDSILDSGVPSLEVVICDDASSDGTPALIREWAAKHAHQLARFHFIEHHNNLGLCASLNDIVRMAQGDIIHVIASDDYFLPGGILSKTMGMARHPEWNAAFCDGIGIGPDGNVVVEGLVAAAYFDPARLTSSLLPEELLYFWDVPLHQLSLRRRIFKIHGGEFEYDPTVFCEDVDTVWWAARAGAFGYIPERCQAYRYRTWPQTSNRSPLREQRDLAHLLAKNAPFFPAHVRGAMERLSRIYFHTAAGNDEDLDLLRLAHQADREAYLRRAAGNLPPPSVSPWQPDHSYQEVARKVLAERDAAKETIQSLKKAAAIRKAGLAEARRQLKLARQLLQYHSANPLRAMRLWWNRRQSKID